MCFITFGSGNLQFFLWQDSRSKECPVELCFQGSGFLSQTFKKQKLSSKSFSTKKHFTIKCTKNITLFIIKSSEQNRLTCTHRIVQTHYLATNCKTRCFILARHTLWSFNAIPYCTLPVNPDTCGLFQAYMWGNLTKPVWVTFYTKIKKEK